MKGHPAKRGALSSVARFCRNGITQTDFANPKSSFAYLEIDSTYLKIGSANPKIDFANPKSGFAYLEIDLAYLEIDFTYPKSEFAYPKSEFAYLSTSCPSLFF